MTITVLLWHFFDSGFRYEPTVGVRAKLFLGMDMDRGGRGKIEDGTELIYLSYVGMVNNRIVDSKMARDWYTVVFSAFGGGDSRISFGMGRTLP